MNHICYRLFQSNFPYLFLRYFTLRHPDFQHTFIEQGMGFVNLVSTGRRSFRL